MHESTYCRSSSSPVNPANNAAETADIAVSMLEYGGHWDQTVTHQHQKGWDALQHWAACLEGVQACGEIHTLQPAIS